MAKTVSGELVNEYKSVGRGDYGVRVARKGFDATKCSDSNLLFNSGWPIIQIVKVVAAADAIKYLDETGDIPQSYIHTNDTEDDSTYIDENYVYTKKITHYYVDPDDYSMHEYKEAWRVYHGLGYVPMYFDSDEVSNLTGYYLLTNIDIRKDVDYPYTDQPSSYSGMTADYGVRSTARTRSQMPQYGTRGCGFNTNIQSKMVMAVKTELSESKETSGSTLSRVPAAWGLPLDNNTQETSTLFDFECYSFYANTNQTGGKFKKELSLVLPETDEKGGRWQMFMQAAPDPTGLKESIVIIRSPMVAPDYEEIEIQ